MNTFTVASRPSYSHPEELVRAAYDCLYIREGFTEFSDISNAFYESKNGIRIMSFSHGCLVRDKHAACVRMFLTKLLQMQQTGFTCPDKKTTDTYFAIFSVCWII